MLYDVPSLLSFMILSFIYLCRVRASNSPRRVEDKRRKIAPLARDTSVGIAALLRILRKVLTLNESCNC